MVGFVGRNCWSDDWSFWLVYVFDRIVGKMFVELLVGLLGELFGLCVWSFLWSFLWVDSVGRIFSRICWSEFLVGCLVALFGLCFGRIIGTDG